MRRSRKYSDDTGRIKACWKVDEDYLVERPKSRKGQELYLCVTDKYRVVMVDKPIVKPTGYVPDPPDAYTPPLDYMPYNVRPSCRVPEAFTTYNAREFIEWVRAPCFVYGPCTCFCYHSETNYVFAYPCPKKCSEELGMCFSSDEVNCKPISLWKVALRLMYAKIRGIFATYRYLVAIGSSAAYVAPFPPPKAVSSLFEEAVIAGNIPPEQHRYVLDKYGGRVPDIVNFAAGTLSIDRMYVFPKEVPQGITLDVKYIPLDFTPRVACFNYYRIKPYKAHAVLALWYDNNAMAYAVAKAAWEMRKDITSYLMKLLGKATINYVENEYANEPPPPPFVEVGQYGEGEEDDDIPSPFLIDEESSLPVHDDEEEGGW